MAGRKVGRGVRRRGEREIRGLGYHIGHYGCTNRLVKVVRYGESTERVGVGFRMPKAKWKVDCPACDFEHRISVHWRRPVAEMENEKAEVTL